VASLASAWLTRVAASLSHCDAAGEHDVIVNPLAVFRLREARRMDCTKSDLTDAEEIVDLARTSTWFGS